MQLRSSPFVELSPTPLATNSPVRDPLSRVARIVRRRGGEFALESALEGWAGISLRLLVFDSEVLLGLFVSYVLLLSVIVVPRWRSRPSVARSKWEARYAAPFHS